MKAVVFMGERKLEFLEFADPAPGPGEVVLEIKASGMCGNDLKFYRAPKTVMPALQSCDHPTRQCLQWPQPV